MKKGSYMEALLRSDQTVFSLQEIALLWKSPTDNATRVRINYYVKKGSLIHLRRGLYAKDENYNPLELATKIYAPSYVSFETVLVRAGICFQFHAVIYVASTLSRSIKVGEQQYLFIKMKLPLLTNPAGIEHKKQTSIANVERAFLDTLYAHTDYHFDNLSPIRWETVFELLPHYKNKQMEKRVGRLYKAFLAGE
ncbi:MAG: type IV toxin-antitoxin system AbiEi family antitoxin domain-containing protein [bacterium]|nr:type IV toxin-antitoxin system AbiEi family antitoxin domain-containing protein [bacterium]